MIIVNYNAYIFITFDAFGILACFPNSIGVSSIFENN